MSTNTPSLIDTLGSEFNKYLQEKAKTRTTDWLTETAQGWGISPDTLRWLTMIPSWTAKLATFCCIDQPDSYATLLSQMTDATTFETQNKERLNAMAAMLTSITRQGAANAQQMPMVMPPALEDGKPHRQWVYQLSDAARDEVLRYLREKEGQSSIVNSLVACAERVLQARETVEMPENLTMWAQLARRVKVPTELVGLVEESVNQATPQTLIEEESAKPAPPAVLPTSVPGPEIAAPLSTEAAPFPSPTEADSPVDPTRILPIRTLEEIQQEQQGLLQATTPNPALDQLLPTHKLDEGDATPDATPVQLNPLQSTASATPAFPPAYFDATQFDAQGKIVQQWTIPITNVPFNIGRTSRNNLILNDDRVSRTHARIEWRGDGYYIYDNNSSNGTFRVDGKPLPGGEYDRLNDGEEFDIGGAKIFRLIFHLGQPHSIAANAAIPKPPIPNPAIENQTTSPVFSVGRWIKMLELNLNRASQWVATARTLQEHLDPASRVRLDRAAARLELQFRRWDDLQQLKNFLERREQLDAFHALIEGTDDAWALHYLGPGGYGKTTLIRYLVTRLAPSINLPVARVDFDHLDPHYPRYQPGLLLSALAEELRLQAGQAYSFSGFDQSIASFYEKYPPVETSFSRYQDRDWLNDPLFTKVLADFASALKEMGGQVLLVLDTCEELTRVRLAGQPAENVSITFDILEKLHQLEPRLRVIFSGRRPLASAGNGWRFVEGKGRKTESEQIETDAQSPVSRLAARPYLGLFPVTGFNHEESETYLAAAQVNPAFWHAIIEKTKAPLAPVFDQIEWNPTGLLSTKVIRPLRDPKAPRSNPFDVALYTRWVLEDPTITPQKVAETDFRSYVEVRILGRALSELSQEFIMAVTLLGHFDYAMLKATLGVGPENTEAAGRFGVYTSFDGAFQAFSAYEWVTHGNNGWLDIQDLILAQLRQFFNQDAADSNSQWSRMRTQALNYLADRTINDAKLGGNFAAAEVALELFAQQPSPEAFEWFSRLSRMVVSWDWAQLATERLLAVQLEKNPTSLLLQARILVLQGAARLHQFGPVDLRQLWRRTAQNVEEVEKAIVNATPDSYEKSQPFTERLKFIKLMALAGEAAACFAAGDALPETRWQTFWQEATVNRAPDKFAREIGAVLGAIEAAVEAREQNKLTRPLPYDVIEQVYHNLSRNWQWNGSTIQPRMLAAFAHSLMGRAMFYEGKIKDGLEEMGQAETLGRRLAGLVGGSDKLQLDPDWTYLWRAPSDFSARLQIEWGRVARSRLPKHLVETHIPLPDKITIPSTLDHDRLTGLQLEVSEDMRPAADARLPELLGLLAEPPNYSLYAQANAQHNLLPARVSAAKALAGVGRLGEAIDQLDYFITNAEERGEALATLPETQVLVELAAAARLGSNRVRRYNELVNGTDIDSLRWVWGLEGLEGRRQPPVPEWKRSVCLPMHAHCRWRGGYALNKKYALNLINVYNDMATRARRLESPTLPVLKIRYDYDMYQLKLNDYESQLVLRRHNSLPSGTTLADPEAPQFGADVEEMGLRLNHLLLAQCRYQALTLKNKGDEIIISSFVRERLGERYAARLLLQDGELLALRLPGRAVYMLSAARSLFQAGRDNDPLSAAYAGVCETQALIRDGQTDRAKIVWKEVAVLYEKFRTEWPNLTRSLYLPDWKTIERAYTNPDDTEFVLNIFKSLDRNWEPWMARLLFTGLAVADDTERWLIMRRALNTIITASAEKEEGLNLLPAELDGLLDDGTTTESFSPLPKRPPKFGDILPPNPFTKRLPKLEISLGAQPSRHPLLTDEPISVRLRDTARTSEAGTRTSMITYRPWRDIKYVQGDPAQEQIAEREMPISWLRLVEKMLGPGRFSKRVRSTPIVLQVQDGLSFLPWEALRVGNVSVALQPGVALRRITKSWFQREFTEVSENQLPPSVLLSCDASLDGIRKVFEPLREKNLVSEINRVDLESLTNSETLNRISNLPGLVHLIGSTILINQTPRLLLNRRRSNFSGDSNLTLSQSRIQQNMLISTTNVNPADQSATNALTGLALAEMFKAARLFIIQAQPVEDPNWTSDSGYQASYLRAIAEDIFKAGVPAVLTIPPLTLADSNHFINELVQRLAEVDWATNGEDGLIEAISEARRDLAKQREQTVRPALDICLYADSSPRIVLFSNKKVV